MYQSMLNSASKRFLMVALASGSTLVASATPSLAAVGFTGPFDTPSWDLDLYEGVPVPAPPTTQAPTSATTTPTTTLPGPGLQPTQYQCSDPFNVACIASLDPAAGAMTLIGSDANQGNTNGQTGEFWTVQWEVDPVSAPTSVSFDWSYFTDDVEGDDQSYFFVVDDLNNVRTTLLSSRPIGDAGSNSEDLQAGYRFGFGVHTNTNNGGPGYLSISNFQYTQAQVPGPLPLLGAGAAFGWSRLLRKRISGQVANR